MRYSRITVAGLSALALAVPAGTASAGSTPSAAPPPATADWTQPTESVSQPARLVGKDARRDKPTTIVTVANAGDRPIVRTQKVVGRKAAIARISAAQDRPDTLYVGVDHRISLDDPKPQKGDSGPGAAAVADDPLRNQQWALDKLQIEDVWDRSTGSGTVVAVLDTGVDVDHEDIPDNIIEGPDETGEGDSLWDGYGHGTHVAGSIAAITDNATGIAGVAPDAQLMSVKVLDSSGSGYYSWVADGIVAATDRGADVINLSLGGGEPGAMEPAVAYAIAQGVTVVASAGNSRMDGSPISYPAALPGVVAVAATDDTDAYAEFSTAGDYVDVAAPGVDVLSTTWGDYESWSGTSMAAPHVSALTALLIAAGDQDPAATITESAVDLGPTGRDNDFGSGLMDPMVALDLASLPPGALAPTEPQNATAVTTGPGAVTVTWEVPADDGGAAIRRYQVRSPDHESLCVVPAAETTCEVTGLAGGRYEFEVTARNAAGYSPAAITDPVDVVGPSDNAGDTIGGAADLAWNTPTDELIHDAADRDFWRLEADEPSELTVDLTGLPADYDLAVLDAEGTVIGSSDSGDTVSERVTVDAPAGTYYAMVIGYAGAYDETDPYTIEASRTIAVPDHAGDDFATAAPLQWDLPVEELMGSTTDVDFWRLRVQQAGIAEIELSSLPADYDIELVDAQWNFLGASYNAGTQNDSISAELDAGTYYAIVFHNGEIDIEDPYRLLARLIGEAPSAPGSPATVPGDRRVTITWSVPTELRGLTGYRIERRTAGGDWVTAIANTHSRSLTAQVTGLSNGTGYRFRVAGINQWGRGSWSAQSAVATPRTTPGAPTDVVAVQGSGSTAGLEWRAPNTTGGAAITGYRILQRSDDGPWQLVVANTGTTARSRLMTGLEPGVSYQFRVAAVNAAGMGAFSAPSSELVLASAPAAPGKPRDPSVKARSDKRIKVKWTAAAANGGTVEYVVQAKQRGRWHKLARTDATKYKGRVGFAKPGKRLKVRIKATSQYGASSYVVAGKVRIKR